MKEKKGLLIRIDPETDRRLTEICDKEGYKKTGLIRRLIREFVDGHAGTATDPIQGARDFGIDISLLEASLRKAPTERLETNRELARFKEEAKRAREKLVHAGP